MKRFAGFRAPAWGLLMWLAGAPAVLPVRADAQSRDERAVRAAYVFNLIKYVEWPGPEKELVIGFTGDAATGEVMERLLGGKASEGRTIRVVLYPSDEELEKCGVLYVAGAPTPEVRKALEKVKGRGVLTVGEAEGFARDGGMVGLVKSGDHIQLEVNLEAAQGSGIRISSRVLNLAEIVRPAGKGGS